MGIAAVARKIYNTLKYGKQIGVTTKNGVSCYANTSKGKTVYTRLNNANSVVGKKVKFIDSPNLTRTMTYDAKGNLLADSTHYREQLGFGLASKNQHSALVRNIRNEYNLLGQTTHTSDITFKPALNDTKATVFRNIDGQTSKTYINTLDGSKYTMKCVE